MSIWVISRHFRNVFTITTYFWNFVFFVSSYFHRELLVRGVERVVSY